MAKQDIKKLVDELNVYVSNLSILYTKIHNYHWYIEGTGFFQLHKQYEEYYTAVAQDYDLVAERLLIMGYKPIANTEEYVKLATLKNRKSEPISTKESVSQLKEDFKHISQHTDELIALTEELGDDVTNDMLIELKTKYDKYIWMLDSYEG
ncbi:Dps family protein [Clostridium polynesiense]|uniref:Dps family protein n=1 Tax=Clostridium polynesiense TaxID=1325933 RepID=UPI000590D27E|nr:DNA starvation/stationary phase protection protein [Clostridium polynesiense]